MPEKQALLLPYVQIALLFVSQVLLLQVRFVLLLQIGKVTNTLLTTVRAHLQPSTCGASSSME